MMADPRPYADRRLAATTLCLLLLALPIAAIAGPAARYCRRVGADDTLRPIPRSLVPEAARLFFCTANPPAEWVRRSTVFRCSAGRVLLCNPGANLPCGKANASRRLAGADAWCAGHPGSSFVPAYATGHDTIYRWRCIGARAEPFGAPLRRDRRGFIARFWKPLGAAPPRCP
jgi:hypothetical protein